MDLNKYLNKKIRVDLINGYFYDGFVINVDANSIEIRDRNGSLVTIANNSILFIKEVNER